MGNSSVKRIVVSVVISLAAFAKPSDPEDSEDDDNVSTGTETDSSESLPSSPSSPEKPEPSNAGKNSPGICAADDVEPYKAVCPESFTHEHLYSQINTPSNEYGVPGPPTSQYASTRDPENRHDSSKFHSHSVVSEDRLPSNDSNVSLNATQNGRSQFETSDLSVIDLSVDARVCRLQRPRRTRASKKTGKSKDKTSSESNNETASIHEKGEEKQAEDDKAQKLNDGVGQEKGHTHDKDDEIMAFIRDFVNKTGITESKHLKFFDAAVVYDTADYTTVNTFITEVKAIVEPRLREPIRIELFDSVEFAQSKVLVVEDVIDRCSVVFVYLTKNCNQETFKLFCDEGIGITRLGLGMVGGARDHERKWVIKPVHTQPPKFRRYKTPVGLVSLQGIDWFDKDSDHTRDRLVYLMEHAVKQRKRKEGESSSTQIDSTILEQNILSSISNKPRNDGKQRKNNHFVENPSLSEDAMSFHSQPSGFAMFNQAPASRQGCGYQEPPIHVQAPSMPVPAPGFYGQQPLNLQGYQFPTIPPSNQLLMQAANGHVYAVNQFGQPQIYPGQQQMYQAPYLSQVQMSGHYPQQAHIPNHQQPLQQTSPYTSQAQMQNQFQHHQGPPLPLQQNVNVQPPIVQSAGVYQPQMQPQQHYQNNINNPSPVPNVPNHQIHPNYQPQAMRDQQQASSTQLDAGSATGDYMRDRRNDAPAESELSVVSRVTGKLIVNPNLSTDDIEIDDPSGRGEPECRPRTSEKRSNSERPSHDHGGDRRPRSRQQRTPSHNDHASSSDDSDTELPISKGKSKKDKVIHIYGCKNVQFGSDNKVIEKKEGKKKRRTTRKRSSETEAPDAVEPSMNSLKFSEMKQTGTLMEEIHDSSRHARSTVHEDNIDIPSCRMEHTYQNTAGEPRPVHHDEARNCLGDIDSEMFHRRMQRQSQSQITDEPTQPLMLQNMLNPLDRESHTDANNSARVGCRSEYNLQESISNVSPSENISDSDLFGGGVFETVRTNVADNHCMGNEVRKESPEVKTYNREAGFAFSNFMGNRHSMKTNSTHSGEDLSGSHKAKFDELD